ncbi:MAG: glycosyl hydrolase family 28-related protein, partial [Phycisphaerae bacterium]
NAAGATRGGKWVFVPAGTYLISTHLTIPTGVTLKGSWQITPGSGATAIGATLLAVEGAGNPNGTSFIRLYSDSRVEGIRITYPNQTSPTADPFIPVAYPWTFESYNATNANIVNCYVENPYQCLKVWGQRCNVRGLYAQPLYKGIYVLTSWDICRFEDVHFYYLWSDSTGVRTWMAQNAEAFISALNAWQYMSNSLFYGYKYGFHFIPDQDGASTCGQFFNCSAILCGTAAVKVDKCGQSGVLFVNSDFCTNPVYSGDANCESVTIAAEALGNASFNNCSFWGPANRICTINNGTEPGGALFSNCSFRDWTTSQYAITVLGGDTIVDGCYFITPGKCVSVASVASGTIVGNLGAAPAEIQNNAGTNCAVANNVHSADFLDLAELASQWLQPGQSSSNLNADEIVNFEDFAIMAKDWLK